MELCLECKACKSECPTNVDMARLKAEFLHQYQRQHGVSWRNRILGGVAAMSRWGSRLSPVSSWLVRSRVMRWINDRLFGIDRRRVPPRFARKTLRRLFVPSERAKNGRPVLLFPDTFTNHYEPDIGLAAVALFERAGCSVTLGPTQLGCCGRPLISTGQLDRAVRLAEQNVASLYPWAAEGKPIIACEPSCILTIKDDYPALLRGEQRRQAEVVASQCWTLEESLEQSAITFRSGPRRVLVQGHCHQRSLVGMSAAIRLLKRMPESEIVDLDAGCCGMAGAFGYEKEHYEVSRLVGEQRLFPALRQASAETVIVASGFSCRMQIAHFTGCEAIHPALLLRGGVPREGRVQRWGGATSCTQPPAPTGTGLDNT
jgi:Fe-S oxidoreductase